jgi:hypothetical protein
MPTVGFVFLFIVNTTTIHYKPGIGTKVFTRGGQQHA